MSRDTWGVGDCRQATTTKILKKRLEMYGAVCTSRSDRLGDVPYEERNSEGCRLINHNQLQSMHRPSQRSMRGKRFLHFRRMCDGRQTRTIRIWIGSVITGLPTGGGVILWINMKRTVSTEGCHAVVEVMHRKGTIYRENDPLQMGKGRNKDRIKIVLVQQ